MMDCQMTILIELDVKREVESVMLNGDTALLNRGFQNLIGNSIRHNAGDAVFIFK